MYSRVVVGTDGSGTADKAVEAAALLAREWGAALHIVTAYRKGVPGMASASGSALVDSGAEGGVRHDAAVQIVEKADTNWGQGLNVTRHSVADSPADAIIDTAKAVDADLIVVGSKGMRGARRVLGSVPNSVAHGAECAVLIVKTD
jgi:nucleotide-binding universal stress UspA family protein